MAESSIICPSWPRTSRRSTPVRPNATFEREPEKTMWRVTMLLKGARGLAAPQVFDGLLKEHAPLLLAHDALSSRHVKKIVMATACDAQGSGLPNMFDASTEFWFDDEHAAGLGLALLTQDAELGASAARYVAREDSVIWMG